MMVRGFEHQPQTLPSFLFLVRHKIGLWLSLTLGTLLEFRGNTDRKMSHAVER